MTPEAFNYMHRLIGACETQVQLMSTGAAIRRVPQEVLEHTSRQMEARRGNKPIGGLDWEMCFRLAESLDPSFRE